MTKNNFKKDTQVNSSSRKYWFKAKEYGWGWYPASYEGLIVLAVFIVLMMVNAYRLGVIYSSNSGDILSFLVETFSLVIILLVICYRTGEKPKWRWGKK